MKLGNNVVMYLCRWNMSVMKVSLVLAGCGFPFLFVTKSAQNGEK